MMKSIQKAINSYRTMPVPAKAAIWFTGCNICIKGIGTISVPLFTWLLPEAEYGKLSLYMSYEKLILILATWELTLGAYQKGLFKFADNETLFTESTQCLCNLLTLGLFCLIFLFRDSITKLTEMTAEVLTVLFLYTLVQPAYSSWNTRMCKYFKYKSAVIVTLVYSVLNVVVPIATLYIFTHTAEVKFVTTLICSAAICTVFYVPNLRIAHMLKNRRQVLEYWKYLICFGAPLILHSLSYLLLTQSDRVMIGKMTGYEETAYYSVACSIASIITLFTTSVSQSLSPWIYQELEEHKYKDIRRIANYLLCGLALLIVCVALFVPEVIKLLFKENYYESIWCIPPIISSTFFMCLYSLFVNVETYFEKTKYVMYVSVFCAILNIILNYLGILKFGYIACGYTTLFSYIMFALGHFYFMRKIVKANIDGEAVFDKRVIILLGTAILVMCCLILLLYKFIVVRYGVIAIIFLLSFYFRRNIAKFFILLKTKNF